MSVVFAYRLRFAADVDNGGGGGGVDMVVMVMMMIIVIYVKKLQKSLY